MNPAIVLGQKINNGEVAHTVHAHGGRRGTQKIVTVEGDTKSFYDLMGDYATGMPMKDFPRFLADCLADPDRWTAGA